MRALNVLLALVVSLIIGFLVLEGGLHLIPAFRTPVKILQFDPITGWSKIPNLTATRRVAGHSVTFAINENGLRDDPGVGPGKEENTFRVLMLGDSFVEGFTVDRENLFVDQLERWWKAEERRVDVVNAGTEAWSTDQEVRWFLEYGRAYDPDLVLLFPYENDVWWNGQGAYATGQQKPLFNPDGQPVERELEEAQVRGPGPLATLRFLKVLRGKLEPLVKKLRGESTEAEPWKLNDEFKVLLDEVPPDLEDAISRTEGAFMALKEGCRVIGAALIVVPIPSKSAIDRGEREFFAQWEHGMGGQYDGLWSPDRPVNLFLELAREHEIEALDPRAALVAANEHERLYHEKDVEWHFNAAGNRAFARWLHDELDRRAFFPAGHKARNATEMPPAASSGGVPTWLLVFAGLWVVLGTIYTSTYPKEPKGVAFLSVGGLLAVVFTIVLGGGKLVGALPHTWAPWIVGIFVLVVLGFVGYKLGRRTGTILELLKAFTLRGHWYLMPLVVVLLTIGSLLVVAASSPLIAPFIYTLF
jgi:lysophospholipase L1-like esterase